MSHRLIRVTFSIYDLYIGIKKNEIETIKWKKPKSWNVLEEKFINHLSNSQICALYQNHTGKFVSHTPKFYATILAQNSLRKPHKNFSLRHSDCTTDITCSHSPYGHVAKQPGCNIGYRKHGFRLNKDYIYLK